MSQLNWYISASPIESSESGSSQTGVFGEQTTHQESINSNQNRVASRNTAQILAVTSARRSISYLTSNVGKYTGNTRNQSLVNNVSKMINYGVAFAANPIIGATTMAFDAITTGIDNAWEQRWDKVRSQQAKARAGEGVGYRQ